LVETVEVSNSELPHKNPSTLINEIK